MELSIKGLYLPLWMHFTPFAIKKKVKGKFSISKPPILYENFHLLFETFPNSRSWWQLCDWLYYKFSATTWQQWASLSIMKLIRSNTFRKWVNTGHLPSNKNQNHHHLPSSRFFKCSSLVDLEKKYFLSWLWMKLMLAGNLIVVFPSMKVPQRENDQHFIVWRNWIPILKAPVIKFN